MITLLFCKLDSTSTDNCFEQLLPLVSYDKQKRINALSSDTDKKLSLYADVLLRALICIKLGISSQDITFVKNKYGKPFLSGYPDFHYNISHTYNAVVIALSDKPVGVDVERIRSADLRIAKRFFTNNECHYITEASNEIDARFFEIWTKKEAFIKYIGKGLSIPLDSFDAFDESISQGLKTEVIDGYIVSVFNEDYCRECSITELNENDIISKASVFQVL